MGIFQILNNCEHFLDFVMLVVFFIFMISKLILIQVLSYSPANWMIFRYYQFFYEKRFQLIIV